MKLYNYYSLFFTPCSKNLLLVFSRHLNHDFSIVHVLIQTPFIVIVQQPYTCIYGPHAFTQSVLVAQLFYTCYSTSA